MNRREFQKSTLTVTALGSGAHLAGAAENPGNMDRKPGETGPQVTRRPYKNTGMTLPLLGFGLMRLPQKDGKVDYPTAEAMVERAMKAGCNYFDTAYMYHDGESEKLAGRFSRSIRATATVWSARCRSS